MPLLLGCFEMNARFDCCPAFRRALVCLCAVSVLGAGMVMTARSTLQEKREPVSVVSAAQAFLNTLNVDQKKTALLDYATPQRFEWHFIPKDERKGLQVKNMQPEQRRSAMRLLRASLSAAGYQKASRIMQLEGVLRELEKARSGGAVRDPQRYYFTLFGTPSQQDKWGLSIEGHHLSLNFVFQGDAFVSSTPTFFATNPAELKDTVGETLVGTRVLAAEELLAFSLVHLLTPKQRDKAVIADQALQEIRAAGEKQPPQDPASGLDFAAMNSQQRQTLRALVGAYAANMPGEVARKRMKDIEEAGWDNVHFAWAGPDRPGVGHYYRVQGPTFLIEFVNTQPDAAGNPANHIHCVWRDMRGDFDEAITAP